MHAWNTSPPKDSLVADEDDIAIVAIEDSIDLHGFRPRDILDVVDSYLEAAIEEGFSEVRLIHGRGKGVQRRNVQQLLAKHPLVADFCNAPAHRGGWGATLVWLRAPQTSQSKRKPGQATTPRGEHKKKKRSNNKHR